MGKLGVAYCIYPCYQRVCVFVCVHESHGERYQETESGRERTRETGEKKKGGKKKSVEIHRCKSTMVVLNGFGLFVQLT